VATLPMGIRGIFNNFIEALARQTTVSAVGLFGSWSRYDASPNSDYDILVAVRGGPDYELHELVEYDGLLMDITRVSTGWMEAVVDPRIDQVLHETIILYDPSGMLKRARDWVELNYRTPGRIEVRTEQYLQTADTYFSRASASMVRNDLETACLFSDLSMVPVAETVMDLAGYPITRSSFLWNLRRSCDRISLPGIYKTVISNTRLSGLIRADVEEYLERFVGLWRRINQYMADNQDVVGGLHDMLRDDIRYRTEPQLVEWVSRRVGEMIDKSNHIEAANYMRAWMLPVLEDYAWLISRKQGTKFDYTSLFRTIREYEGPTGIYDEATVIFNLRNLGEEEIRRMMNSSRGIVGHVRSNRRGLIEGLVG
jgi:predicted nucleotidyltransferase